MNTKRSSFQPNGIATALGATFSANDNDSGRDVGKIKLAVVLAITEPGILPLKLRIMLPISATASPVIVVTFGRRYWSWYPATLIRLR